MTLLVHYLHYLLSNISNVIQWLLFLIGSLLVLLPIYHGLINKSTTFLKASQACTERLGMHRFINLYYINNSLNKEITVTNDTTSRSALPSADIVTCELNTQAVVDTQICLLSNTSSSDNSLLVSGLVNTGNSCFLNSVLQSLSALPKLQVYLNGINNLPSSKSLNLPVTRSLLRTLSLLSVPSNTAFRPIELVSAMSSNRRVVNREQQDAQELFQLISGELDSESQTAQKKQGFRDILNLGSSPKNLFFLSSKEKIKSTIVDNPFTGLLANRLSCTQCGYTEAIRHFSFNNVQLTLPNSDTTTLDDCLKQLTTMEYLNDVTCRKCSLLDTVRQLSAEIDSLQSSQKREKLICLQKIKQDIEHRLDVGRIEEESHDDSRLKGFLSKVNRVSSKQAMFAKPPKVLCLHIARSAYLPTGEIYKNTCQIKFPEVLDLAPYCTNGTLNTQPDLPISTNASASVRYRLMSSIVHYGSHNFGHFIAYKRRLVAEKCSCHACCDDATLLKHHHSDWFKISDERVDSCGVDEVLEANPYMLLYELIDDDVAEDIALESNEIQVVTKLSTIVVDQEIEEDEDEDEDCITPNLPAAPPSSPLLLPLQLSSSIASSCSSFQPLTTKPQRRRNSKKNLWTNPPVAIY